MLVCIRFQPTVLVLYKVIVSAYSALCLVLASAYSALCLVMDSAYSAGNVLSVQIVSAYSVDVYHGMLMASLTAST